MIDLKTLRNNLITIFFFLTTSLVWGHRVFEIPDTSFGEVSIHNSIKHYHDYSENLTYTDISKFPDSSFQTFEKEYLNLGYRNRSNWFLIDLEQKEENIKTIYLKIRPLFIQQVDVSIHKDGKKIKDFPSQGIRKNSPQLIGKYYYFPIKITEKGQYKIVINLRNPYGSMRPAFYLLSENEYQEVISFREKETPYYFFFTGVISLIIIISLITFFIRREFVFLTYALFASINLIITLFTAGFLIPLHQKTLPYLPHDIRAYYTFLLLSIALIYSYTFHKHLIKKKWIVTFYRCLVGYLLFTVLASPFYDYKSPFFIFQSYIVVGLYCTVIITILSFMIIGLRARYIPSYFLLVAYSCYSILTIYAILFLSKIINNYIVPYPYELSVSFEIIVMAIGMAYQILSVSKDNKMLKEKIQAEQENFIKQSIQIQDNERTRIAKDLHDDIGQQLTGLKLLWYTIKNNTKTKDDNQESLSKFTGILENTIENVRQMSHKMMPSHLLKAGLDKSLEELCLTTSIGENKVFYSSFNLPFIQDENILVNVYRALQEGISNSQKHGKAKVVEISASYVNEKIIILQIDNGKGFDVTNTPIGYGLSNIQNRIHSIKGIVDIDSNKNTGTTLTFRIPYLEGFSQ